MDLTVQDCEALMDAVDAWRSKEASDHLITTLIGGLASPTKEARDKFLDEETAKAAAREKKRRIMDERATLLKAKLIAMRDSLAASSLSA